MKNQYNRVREAGMDPQKLYEMLLELEEKAQPHSICILKEGKTVLEAAWAPFSLEEPQMMHSLSKIGTAICVGFAIEEGKLRLEDSFLDYVREELPEDYDQALEEITIYDLLTMQAGSPCCCNNVWFTKLEKDWERHWLGEKKIREDIGKVFHYDSGCSYTLSRIVSRVMGKTCLEILEERVFPYLDFGKVNWLSSPEGHSTGGWGMYLTAPMIAKLGWLVWQDGMWEGQQILPKSWVQEMKRIRVIIPGAETAALKGYAYHIKAGEKIYAAEGAFGQLMICFRDHPIVIGLTSGTTSEESADICQRWILEALEEAGKEEDEVRLEEKQKSLSLPFAPGERKSRGSEEFLGKWFQLEKNPRNIKKIRFTREEGEILKIRCCIGEEEKELRAGFGKWVKNDLYPEDYTKRYHSLSYGFEENRLWIAAGLINTSYFEIYHLDLKEEGLECGWKPNVTYLDGNDNRERKFLGKREEYQWKSRT